MWGKGTEHRTPETPTSTHQPPRSKRKALDGSACMQSLAVRQNTPPSTPKFRVSVRTLSGNRNLDFKRKHQPVACLRLRTKHRHSVKLSVHLAHDILNAPLVRATLAGWQIPLLGSPSRVRRAGEKDLSCWKRRRKECRSSFAQQSDSRRHVLQQGAPENLGKATHFTRILLRGPKTPSAPRRPYATAAWRSLREEN